MRKEVKLLFESAIVSVLAVVLLAVCLAIRGYLLTKSYKPGLFYDYEEITQLSGRVVIAWNRPFDWGRFALWFFLFFVIYYSIRLLWIKALRKRR